MIGEEKRTENCTNLYQLSYLEYVRNEITY